MMQKLKPTIASLKPAKNGHVDRVIRSNAKADYEASDTTAVNNKHFHFATIEK